MVPAPIVIGSIVFASLLATLIAIIFAAMAMGGLSKDNAAIGNVVVTVAIFFMWLFWICAWLHQWHPLIKPIYEGV
eukprot:CAMPEP_0116822670 /NCGR_PEP_ID=MMETSP0418-20121206/397_1 /TAXON_ID=1158023 /ORGANISM="Astrosyne radiata, Strain 13vi08-1A" /LENGTH=75 /DNA_ID=CAMNT_0004450809 /DNA_START=52 /DNA_END=279 /DNA_ORIENTATION=-